MRAAFGLLVVGAALAVGACSAGEEGAEDGLSIEEVAARYNYDVDTAEYTPVYELAPAFVMEEEERVRHIFFADCLKDVVDYRLPTPNAGSDLRGRDGQPLFNEEIAAEWGYPNLRWFPFEPFGIPEDELTPEVQAEYDRCGSELATKFVTPSPIVLNDIDSAGWDATKDNPDIQKAEEAWVECMAPEGIVDLPDSPWEMPPSGMRGTPDEDGNIIDQEIELTEKERFMAIADARCQAEVGYKEAFFRARAEGELAAIGKDLESFEASRVEFEEFQKALDTVLAEHG